MHTATNTPKESKAPSHYAYHLRDGKSKTYWTRIGAAWENKDRQGFLIQLDVVPLDGKIALRIASEKKDAATE